MNTISEESIFGNDVLAAIMDKASPWTSYCMALTCKDMLKHYESGKCPHNPPSELGVCNTISSVLQEKQVPDESISFYDPNESDSDSTKSFKARQKLQEDEWLASQDVAGRSQPLGDLGPNFSLIRYTAFCALSSEK